eukprot:TRINITY_DN6381_c0_g1_i1.p1 TRINITY_DN6381_c0_g1~~TRINITY_DN6381_c0_g1_i1.p1  ORF type:complete len:273 (+),score=60.27 TRINITY_DN6381_c0_g1_i1:62-820(+)
MSTGCSFQCTPTTRERSPLPVDVRGEILSFVLGRFVCQMPPADLTESEQRQYATFCALRLVNRSWVEAVDEAVEDIRGEHVRRMLTQPHTCTHQITHAVRVEDIPEPKPNRLAVLPPQGVLVLHTSSRRDILFVSRLSSRLLKPVHQSRSMVCTVLIPPRACAESRTLRGSAVEEEVMILWYKGPADIGKRNIGTSEAPVRLDPKTQLLHRCGNGEVVGDLESEWSSTAANSTVCFVDSTSDSKDSFMSFLS